MTNAIRLLFIAALPICLASCSGDTDSTPTDDVSAVSANDPLTNIHSAGTEQSTRGSNAEHGHDQHASGGHAETSHSNHNTGHGNSEHGSETAHVKQPSDATHSKHGHTGQAAPKDGHGEHGHGADQAAGNGRSENGKTSQANEAVDRLSAELAGADAATIFARRILPILKTDSSSSCTECHFAGVELRDFILDDQAKTFASLKSTGMIDVDRPDESKILRFIGRKPEKSNPLIAKVRENEFVAFRSWIRAAVREPELLKATSNVEVGTSLPPEVIRHARRDRVLSSFIDNIWSEMGRCINCHNPERNRQKIGRNGFTKDDVDAISWIVPKDPAATLKELVDGGNIDRDDPSASPVLTKPSGFEEHGGGPKFLPGSSTYRNFLAFLTDYANTTNGKYQSADDLPSPTEEITLLSEQQLRITDIPAAFSDMPLQVDIYRRMPQTGKWSEHRWATGFSRVNGKQHIWQNPIMVAAPADSLLAKEFRDRKLLPPGEYRIRILIDRTGETKKDPTYKLGDAEFVGEVEFNGAWKPGYQPPNVVTFPKLTNARADVGHNRHQQAAKASNQVASKHHTQHKETMAIGEVVPDFEVTLDGHVWKLSELRHNRKITPDGTLVLTFWCSFCHSCRHVEFKLDKLATQYKGKAGVIALDASFGETVEEVRAVAKKNGLTLPIALNADGSAADVFGVNSTTTTVVIDAVGRLRYLGQFADSKHPYVEDALNAVLAGKVVPVSKTLPKG